MTRRGITSFGFTCFLIWVQSFDLPYMTEGTVAHRPSTLIPYNFEKHCLYTDYKWKLCPQYASANEMTSVAKSSNLEELDRQLDDEMKLYYLFLSIPPNVPKSIHGLFRYWNWLLMNIPKELLSEDVPPPISVYLGQNERGFATARIGISKDLGPNFSQRFESDEVHIMNIFVHSLNQLEKKFYGTTYATLQAITAPDYMNGISFALSGFFLQIALVALSTEVDRETKAEIDKCTGFVLPEQNRIEVLKNIIALLPASSDRLKFRYATRLVLRKDVYMSEHFLRGAAAAASMKIEYLNNTESPEKISAILNHMVEIDAGGAMRDTFDDDELSEGVCAVLITTVYMRARWRSPPTLLNGTSPFYDDERAPKRSTRMIRINDIMQYADLQEWDAEALEIKYATTGLTLFLLVPRGRSLRNLASRMSVTNVESIADRMQRKRIAATLPIFTLRMTLLLPAKMQAMGIRRLMEKPCNGLKLSHAVQRIMFWAEAGRYAFKDDGIEWDETPEHSLIFDRPYLFYVRWHNVTILNGNFML